MFDKSKFAQIIKNIKETYNSQEDFSKQSGIGRTYLSQYMNMKLQEPPKPRILEKLASSSNGITTYKELMDICGYSKKTIENKVYSIYENLKTFHKHINNGKSNDENFYEITGFLEYFRIYISILEENLSLPYSEPIFLIDIFDTDTMLEDYKYVSAFLLLYDSFLECLKEQEYITINEYTFYDWFNIENIYSNIKKFNKWELLSLASQKVKISCASNKENVYKYVQDFMTCLNLAYLSDFDNNSLTELFKAKVKLSNNELPEEVSLNNLNQKNDYSKEEASKFYMCPVYGRISAGQPNWAEECIEGRIPIDPSLMDIVNPEEHFFLRVNGESMNKVIRNRAYALIHKQDIVENGEIAVILVNGDEATIKKFSKQGDLVILEPMSDDPSFQVQIYDKNTPIKILGKYVGKFEMNK